jgi:hypothetical protein
VDPYGVGFVEYAVQMLHHPVVKFPTSLSHVLFIALEAAGQIDYPGRGTCEQPFDFKSLFAVVGFKCFCFIDVGAGVTWFIARLHTYKLPLWVT